MHGFALRLPGCVHRVLPFARPGQWLLSPTLYTDCDPRPSALALPSSQRSESCTDADVIRSLGGWSCGRSLSTTFTALALHVTLGGWCESSYVPIWVLPGFTVMFAFDVLANRIIPCAIPVVCFLIADMIVDMELVEYFHYVLAQPILMIYNAPRAIIPLEPIPGLPPPYQAMMALNNFFTPIILLLYGISCISEGRQPWELRQGDGLQGYSHRPNRTNTLCISRRRSAFACPL